MGSDATRCTTASSLEGGASMLTVPAAKHADGVKRTYRSERFFKPVNIQAATGQERTFTMSQPGKGAAFAN